MISKSTVTPYLPESWITFEYWRGEINLYHVAVGSILNDAQVYRVIYALKQPCEATIAYSIQPRPEDTEPQNKVAELILSHRSDPEASTSSPAPAHPLLPAHRHDAPSLANIIHPAHRHHFVCFTSSFPNYKWKRHFNSVRVDYFPQEIMTGPQHIFRKVPVTTVVRDPLSRASQPRLQAGFQELSFYFLAAGKEARRPGLFS